MYTENYDETQNMGNISINSNYGDDYNNNDDELEPSFWNRNRSFIIKIIGIVVCIIVLVWLIVKLGTTTNNSNQHDSMVYDNNINTIRLASEKYFFIRNNMPVGNEVKTITLKNMNSMSLANSIVDYNNKACNANSSYASLNKSQDAYILKINLVCDNENTVKIYYYDLITNKCLNCQKLITYMDGNKIEKDDSNAIIDISDNLSGFSCKEWSPWTSEIINDSSLSVKTRTLVKGMINSSSSIIYGEWSEYTETPIIPNDNLEVETISESQVVVVNNNRVTSTSCKCPEGFTRDGDKCFKKGDLKFSEAIAIGFKGIPCDGLSYNANGEQVFKNCPEAVRKDLICTTSDNSDDTSEQVVVKTKYRSRTKTMQIVEGNTTDYILESELPAGYTKIPNSEKIEYAYKLNSCEK